MTLKPPKKYNAGDQVYNKNDVVNGNPTRRPLWISDEWFNKKTREWQYRVRDGPLPSAREIGRISEGGLGSL